MHMPGHKGAVGIEREDVTEIYGADSLFEADGIIRESEECASALFGARSFYSTEGSSLAIRAMLYLATITATARGERPLILAGRNAHKVFISTAALLDFDIDWLHTSGSYMSCSVDKGTVREALDRSSRRPVAVYLTSPDYLGNTVDIRGIAEVCHERGVLLLVDNAHGAYLKFLNPSRHPIDLGADMCADSAHKTLPALTGAAYLHISPSDTHGFSGRAKEALSLFASTSPSYLILASLDRLNAYLDDGYSEKLTTFVSKIREIKQKTHPGLAIFTGDEDMKITVRAAQLGYTGYELAALLRAGGVEPEFADPDFLVLMPTPSNKAGDLELLFSILSAIEPRAARRDAPPALSIPERVMTPRDAMLADSEVLPTESCLGRILATVTVGCPPAVPILVSGERISEDSLRVLEYYGVSTLRVVK